MWGEVTSDPNALCPCVLQERCICLLGRKLHLRSWTTKMARSLSDTPPLKSGSTKCILSTWGATSLVSEVQKLASLLDIWEAKVLSRAGLGMSCWLPCANSLRVCFLKREYISSSWVRGQGRAALIVCPRNCVKCGQRSNTRQAQEVRLSGLVCKPCGVWDLGQGLILKHRSSKKTDSPQ